ncbi:MAG: hypothetical protein WBO46_14280, partial [Caldilineaceae bacterium]
MTTQAATPKVVGTQVERERGIRRLRKLSWQDWVVEILKYTILLALAVTFLLPFYWMISSAIKTDTQVYTV